MAHPQTSQAFGEYDHIRFPSEARAEAGAAPDAVNARPGSVAVALSPALHSFESNPFRVLRLAVNATTSRATFQAEQALTLARVGLSPDEPDALPWLKSPGVYEIQRSAQSAEEPFVRLRWQLQWFDLERDPHSALLVEALRNPKSPALPQYLDSPLWLPQGSTGDSASDAVLAHAVNQANLHLLAAAAGANGFLTSSPTPRDAARTVSKAMWKQWGPFRSLEQPHTLGQDTAAGDLGGRADWAQALQKWTSILVHPLFGHYLERCISDLHDDFVSVDDVETIEESLRAHLADLCAQEARFFLQAGRYPIAASLIAAISNSGMELRILAPAMRPLRQVFQSEIAELASLIEESADLVASVDAYLKRLNRIRERWVTLDSAGIVGLRDILDEAVEKVYLRLRAGEATDGRVGELLTRAKEIATAESLKERVSGFEKELEQVRTRRCYFCGGTPDYDRSVVLNGKKETGRTYSYPTTTIHYSVRSAIVLRCGRCARLHTYIGSVGLWASLGALPGLLALIYAAFWWS